jgi:hypothetical protein
MSASASASRARSPALVFIFFACLYILSIGRGFYSSDGEVMFKTTAALVTRHTFALAPDPGLPQIVLGRDQRYYSKYDPGLPLIAVPFYEIGDRLGQINHAHRYRLSATLVLLVPALAAAGTLFALARLANGLTSSSSHVGRNVKWVILAAGLANPLWMYGRMLFAESLLAFSLTAAVGLILLPPAKTNRFSLFRLKNLCVLCALGGESFPFFAAGVIVGVGLLTRAAFAIYLPALIWLIARQSAAHDRLPRLAAFGVGLLPWVALLLWHNVLRFGDPFQFGYAGESFTTPPWEGIPRLLISPGKGVFFYAPPLILSLILWPRFRRAYPALGECLALAWITVLPFYGTWWAWDGGWSWGPRFLVPLIPLSGLPLIMLPEKRTWRRVAAALILAGIVIQAAAVLTDLTPHYAALAGRTALYYDPRRIPQVAAARRLLDGQTEPLAMFHLSATGLPPTWSVGVPLVLVAGLVFSSKRVFPLALANWPTARQNLSRVLVRVWELVGRR